MPSFLSRISEEIRGLSVAEVASPQIDLREGDVVIGVVGNPETKKIWGLIERVDADILKATWIFEGLMQVKNRPKFHNTADCKVCAQALEVSALKRKRMFLNELFWTCVLDELSKDGLIRVSEMDSPAIGIRKNWQIVATIANSDPGPLAVVVAIPSLSR